GEDVNGTNDIWRMCLDDVDYPRLAWEYSMYGDFVCGDGLDMYDFDYLDQRYLSDGCGGLVGSGGGTVDLGVFANMGQYWLTVDCGDCGGADVSGDGGVGLEDMLLCSEQWLCSAPVNWDRADLDCDGQVNEIDIDIWIDFWLAAGE
ncbi:MAG: dockerin type I domain-containing protein, partial [Planctomycetota bacterium]